MHVDDWQNPGSEYRGMPFWAWNTRMTPEHIDRMLEAFREMGMGGAYLHSRTGMDNPYMSEEFLSLVRYAHDRAAEKGMLTGLYDEDRWASGFGGGFVTHDHRFRRRFLVFSPVPPEEFDAAAADPVEGTSFSGERTMLGKYIVTLKDGYLADYVPAGADEKGDNVWYAWCEVNGSSAWYNNEAYVDTLNPDAIRRFIDVTHEAYAKELGEYFGRDIPAIFTDEPSFATMTMLPDPYARRARTMPYTEALEELFQKTYGDSLVSHLPELFFLMPDGHMSLISYRYHDLLCELFVQSYCDQIGAWCREHNIAFTGHLFREDALDCQTYALGEAMRGYRSFDIPGVDVLSDRRRINTVKQVVSAAHQLGRSRVVCEMYGVTYWTFDFRGHKLSGDWQAALGITNRVHHLAWTSMAGDAKRDYPASICYQSPWYKQYPLIEDYFARLNTVLTRGKPVVRVAVLHPIETYWMYWGPESQTGAKRDEMDRRFTDLTNWLLFGLCDFDFVSEGLLKDFPPQPDEPHLRVGEMRYDVLIVPACETIRRTTYERLQRFANAGGRILFLERKPDRIDAVPSGEAQSIPGEVLPFSRYDLLHALENDLLLSVYSAGGHMSDNLFSQLREEDGCRYLFLAHVYPPRNADIPEEERWTVTVRGRYSVTLWDALIGNKTCVPVQYRDGCTVWQQSGYVHDSWLYSLETVDEETKPVTVPTARLMSHTLPLPKQCGYRLHEDNVLVLDRFEWHLDDEQEWQPKEEILRIRKAAREALHYRSGGAQPWTREKTEPRHTLYLRTDFRSGIETKASLALENAEMTGVYVNGKLHPERTGEYYVDPAIRRTGEFYIWKGKNTIELKIPFGEQTSAEAVYLLGRFAVRLQGCDTMLAELPEQLSFADLTTQGLPFYGGNVDYIVPFGMPEAAHAELEASMFRCPLIGVQTDGKNIGSIAFAPYWLSLGELSEGRHELICTVYGNRVNTFGALHLADANIEWKGPNMWTTQGAAWSDEYQLRPTGLLKAPIIFYGE